MLHCITVIGIWITFVGCSDPVERERLQVSIDADLAVRELTVEVGVRVERQDPNGGSWFTVEERRFTPADTTAWPLRLSLPTTEAELQAYYQMTSTARDNRGAVVAEARMIRDLGKPGATPLLRTRLEADCLRRTVLCVEQTTCHAGQCVDAEQFEPDATAIDDGSTTSANAATIEDAGTEPALGQPGQSCLATGALTCADGEPQTPLRCVSGTWEPQLACQGQERCIASSGTCRSIAPECVGRSADEVFCDGETMLVCADRVSSEPRPCGEHQRCVDSGGSARCGCSVGFVPGMTGCREATECGHDHGGCDPQADCQIIGGKVECGACPPGYSGDGRTGCQPLLAALDIAGGTLTPAFAPDVHAYRVDLPLVALRAIVRALGPAGANVQVDTHAVAANEAWASPLLALGDTTIEVAVVSSPFGVESTYQLVVHRAGSEESYLKAGSPSQTDYLGVSLALAGDTLLATVALEDSATRQINGDEANDSARESGAAYVYVRTDAGWTKQAYLKASDAMANDRFGGQASMSSDTIVVGAVSSDIGTASTTSGVPPRPGHAYVFTRTGGVWTEQEKLSASDGFAGDWFGYGVAIDGDTIVIGAPHAGGRSDSSGCAYVFTRTGEAWSEVAILRPKSPVASSMFGSSVRVRGNVLLVAAEQEANGQGAVYVFMRRNGAWVEQQRLAGDPPADNTNFGFDLTIRGETIVIGAPGAAVASLFSAPGSVYVFERAGDSFHPAGVLHASVPRTSDYFGCSLCLTDQTMVVGASGDASGARGIDANPMRTDGNLSGAVYLFTRDPAGWSSPTFLKSSNSDPRDGFGYAVSCSETHIAVSAPFESSRAAGINGDSADNSLPGSGAIYIFR
jgi:hypothetical protein